MNSKSNNNTSAVVMMVQEMGNPARGTDQSEQRRTGSKRRWKFSACSRNACDCMQKQKEAMDAQIAREQLDKLQQEFDARSARMHEILQLQKRREKLAISQAKADVEMKILRASNENAAYHEEAMKLEKEQAAREISCLKEDLEAERKRFAALLKRRKYSKKTS